MMPLGMANKNGMAVIHERTRLAIVSALAANEHLSFYYIGGSDESDLELLTTTDWLMKNVRLRRAYFSAFHPIRDTPMENKPAVNPLREHRLYQASFLLRDYGFDLEEMPFDQAGRLPLSADPKQAWAAANLLESPVEVNRAGRQELRAGDDTVLTSGKVVDDRVGAAAQRLQLVERAQAEPDLATVVVGGEVVENALEGKEYLVRNEFSAADVAMARPIRVGRQHEHTDHVIADGRNQHVGAALGAEPRAGHRRVRDAHRAVEQMPAGHQRLERSGVVVAEVAVGEQGGAAVVELLLQLAHGLAAVAVAEPHDLGRVPVLGGADHDVDGLARAHGQGSRVADDLGHVGPPHPAQPGRRRTGPSSSSIGADSTNWSRASM